MSSLIPITSLQGPAGQASTSAAGDVAALTAFAAETAGPNAFAATLNSKFSRPRRKIVDVGNSIAANGTVTFLTSVPYSASTGQIDGGALSYMSKAIPQTEGRFCWLGTQATPGAKMAAIASTWMASALASEADYIHLQVITNDFGDVLTGASTLTAMKAAYLSLFVNPILQAGKLPIIAAVNPIAGASNAAPADDTRLLLLKINTWLRSLAAKLTVPFVDYYSVLADAATGAYKTGYSTDGVHPTDIGSSAMGKELARVLVAIPRTGVSESVLSTSYNKALVIPDAVSSSTGSDKVTIGGPTTGGWSFGSASSADWKGSRLFAKRGTAGNSSMSWPMNSGASLVTGHKIRVNLGIDVPLVPAGGTWSIGIFDLTSFTYLCGTTGETQPLTKASKALNGTASVTSGAKTIMCPVNTFTAKDIGKVVTVVNFITSYFPVDTRILGISNDGSIAYCTAAASATQAAGDLFVHGLELCVVSHEFTVDSSQNGHPISVIFSLDAAAGVTGAAASVTVEDLTALEAVA